LVVSGVLVIVFVIVLAVVAGSSGYTIVSVAEALEPSQRETRVQVTGRVVTDSSSIEGNTLSFALYDPDGSPEKQLKVVYEGGVSATFGNQVTAICTGMIDAEGVLIASELVTKCPSKYESATDALSVSQLLGYGSAVVGKPLKIAGVVKPGSLGSIDREARLVLRDEVSLEELPILFGGALPDDIGDNTELVITGSLNSDGQLEATDIALREK